MVLVETSIFTRQISKLLDAESYRELLLLAYGKNVQEDLSPTQLKMLRRLVEEELK